MEDLRNSDWQAIQLLLMLLVIVKEDRTAFITLPSASQRGNTQIQGPVPRHVLTSPVDPRWAEHTQAPELLWSGINPPQSIPPQPCVLLPQLPAVLCSRTQHQRAAFQQAQGEDFALWTLISLWKEAQTCSMKQGPPHWLQLPEKTGPSGIHLWRGKTGFLYYTGIILHLFTDKKNPKVSTNCYYIL